MAKSIELAKVFVSIEAETKGLDNQLQQAERSLGRTAEFIKAHPVAAASALTATLLAVGAQATKMAGEVDAAFRQASESIPGAVARIDELKQSGRELSDQFGKSQLEVAALFQELGRAGIEGADEAKQAAKAVLEANRATGEDWKGLVATLDGALDSFQISGKQSTQVMAQLFETAKGKTSLVALGEELNRVGPAAHAAGLTVGETGAALSRLATEGGTTKQHIAAFTQLLEREGADAVRAYAGEVVPAAAAMDAMREAADRNLTTLPALEEQLKTRLNNTLIEFGSKALPLAIEGLELLNEVLGHFTGRTKEAAAEGSIDRSPNSSMASSRSSSRPGSRRSTIFATR